MSLAPFPSFELSSASELSIRLRKEIAYLRTLARRSHRQAGKTRNYKTRIAAKARADAYASAIERLSIVLQDSDQ